MCHASRRGPIKWRSSLKNTIYDVLQSKTEWVETESETDWDFFWADKGYVSGLAGPGKGTQDADGSTNARLSGFGVLKFS